MTRDEAIKQCKNVCLREHILGYVHETLSGNFNFRFHKPIEESAAYDMGEHTIALVTPLGEILISPDIDPEGL